MPADYNIITVNHLPYHILPASHQCVSCLDRGPSQQSPVMPQLLYPGCKMAGSALSQKSVMPVSYHFGGGGAFKQDCRVPIAAASLSTSGALS